MTNAVHDYKSIARRLNRQDQKAEFEAKNPKVEQSAYDALSGGMFGIGSPLMDQMGSTHAGRLTGAPFQGDGRIGTSVPLDGRQPLPPYTPSLKSLAHPNWPYQGTGFEWAKFVKVRI